MNERLEAMEKIQEEVLALTKSPLYAYRVENKNVPVIGEGSHNAEIVFVGEAPGKNEAETGKPFCGKSGKVLDHLLTSVGIDRKDVYVTNVVKDRPPGNRDPSPQEIDLYAPFLDRQIEIIKPKVIATLGRFSMAYIMKKFGLEGVLEPISALHGKVFSVRAPYGDISIVPLYHPAVAVYNPHMIEKLKDDFKVILEYAKK